MDFKILVGLLVITIVKVLDDMNDIIIVMVYNIMYCICINA